MLAKKKSRKLTKDYKIESVKWRIKTLKWNKNLKIWKIDLHFIFKMTLALSKNKKIQSNKSKTDFLFFYLFNNIFKMING